MTSFINTQLLKEAAIIAETNEEAYLCRLLANSISGGSPYAWKIFYSGEAATQLSKNSYDALEKVMEEAEKMFNTPPCKCPSPPHTRSVSAGQKKAQGVRISEPITDQGKGENRPPIGKGKLKKTEMLKGVRISETKTEKGKGKYQPPIGKGKLKIHEMPMGILDDPIEDQTLPWEGLYIGGTMHLRWEPNAMICLLRVPIEHYAF